MPSKPTLPEWRAANPGKSLNDYYAEHGHHVPLSPPPVQPVPLLNYQPAYQYPPHPQVVYVERTSSVDAFGMVASGVALVAFLMPWVSLEGGVFKSHHLGNVGPTGFPRLLVSIANLGNSNYESSDQVWVMSAWFLGIFPATCMMLAIGKIVTLRVICCYLYTAIAALWLYYVATISETINVNYGVGIANVLVGFRATREPGFMVGVLAAVLMLLDAIQAPWSKR